MSEKDGRISAAKVAQIWNERAKNEYGKEANYTRWSVRGRREDLEGHETELGWLYSEAKARSVDLTPHTAKRPDMATRNRQWTQERKNKRASSKEENS